MEGSSAWKQLESQPWGGRDPTRALVWDPRVPSSLPPSDPCPPCSVALGFQALGHSNGMGLSSWGASDKESAVQEFSTYNSLVLKAYCVLVSMGHQF